MNSEKLIQGRQYYDLKASGKSSKEAGLAVYGKATPASRIEGSPEYLAVISAINKLQKEELKQEVEKIKRKQLSAYSNLLDEGEKMMGEAKTTNDKLQAQANQRANLQSGVVESAIAWDGEDRNQIDMGDILEGVIL